MQDRLVLALLALFAFNPLFGQTTSTTVSGVTGGTATHMVDNASGQTMRVENSDGTVDRYLYDANGDAYGVSVEVHRFLTLTVSYSDTAEGSTLSAGGMKVLTTYARPDGRISQIDLGSSGEIVDISDTPAVIARFNYTPTGQLSELALPGQFALRLASPDLRGNVRQTLLGPDGNLLREIAAAANVNGNWVPAELDAVAEEIGLGDDWSQALTFTKSPSNHLTTVTDDNGTPVLYLIDVGPARVGFTPDGIAVFYDVRANIDIGNHIDDSDAGIDPATDVAGLMPTHVVVTAAGRVGIYHDRPTNDATYSAWTQEDGRVRFASLNPPELELRRAIPKSEGETALRRHLTPKTDALIRYRSTVCVDDICWVRDWFAWVEDGPGTGGSGGGSIGTKPGGGGSGGGRGGSTRGGNNVTNDPALRQKVSMGLDIAKEKLNNPQCQSLLNQSGENGDTLVATMRSRGYTDPAGYISQSISYQKGIEGKCNADVKAYTTVYGSIVNVCSALKSQSISPSMVGVYLIHEMLHTLGLPENPPTAGAKSTTQITNDVRAACGS